MKLIAAISVLVIGVGFSPFLASADPAPFVRGDANADGKVNIADPIWIMNQLFLAGPESPCASAADANDDGQVSTVDAVYLATYLFQHGAVPAVPFPACGADGTADSLTCEAFAPCP